jgi:hypothetical protein
MKALTPRVEDLEVQSGMDLKPVLVLLREPEPGEIEAHRQRGGGHVVILDIGGHRDDHTDPHPR